MTQETFKKTIEINNRINALTGIVSKLSSSDLKLNWVNHTDNVVLSSSQLDDIEDILSEHYGLIVARINDEIEHLKNEIERL